MTYNKLASIQTNDIVYAKDKVTMKVTLTFNDINDASLLPDSGVSISNLGIQINFEQQGNALVKDNGEVANYKVYHQGDKITLNNEDYYVVADSGAGQDYVVALKDEPLTVEEVNTYGSSIPVTAQSVNGYGGVLYGSNTNYATSDVKIIIDAWSADKFQNNELKQIDEYKVRLLTRNEYLSGLNIYNWSHNSKYVYWTMTLRTSDYYQYVVRSDGSLDEY